MVWLRNISHFQIMASENIYSTHRICAMIKLPEDPLGNCGNKLFLHLFDMLPKTGDKNCKLAAERDTEDHWPSCGGCMALTRRRAQRRRRNVKFHYFVNASLPYRPRGRPKHRATTRIKIQRVGTSSGEVNWKRWRTTCQQPTCRAPANLWSATQTKSCGVWCHCKRKYRIVGWKFKYLPAMLLKCNIDCCKMCQTSNTFWEETIFFCKPQFSEAFLVDHFFGRVLCAWHSANSLSLSRKR